MEVLGQGEEGRAGHGAEASLGKKAPLLQPLAEGGAGSAGWSDCLPAGSARLLSIPVGRATTGEGARPRHGGEELGS
jgi:hypothetical protein